MGQTMAVTQFTYIPNRVIDSNGIADGASIYFYLTGTTTLQTIYADAGRTTPLANPVVVAAGAAVPNVYLDPSVTYRVKVETASGVVSDTDPYRGIVDAGNVMGGLPQFSSILSQLENEITDLNIVLAGDSTGDATTEWFYLLAEAVATAYPAWSIKYRPWNNGTLQYPPASEVVIQTGTGARTLTFWNASVSGAVASMHGGANFNAVFEQVSPDLVFLSYGHNGGTSAIRQLSYFSAIIEPLQTRLQDIPVVIIGQNPTTIDDTMSEKVEVLRALAGRNGYGFIDVHNAFLNAGVSLPSLMADTVHPNAAGSQLWADTVFSFMLPTNATATGVRHNNGAVIANYSTVAEFSRWIAVNCTVSKNTTYWETVAHSTQLATTVSGLSYIYTNVVSSDDIISIRGEYVTVNARIRVPSGSLSTTGRIDIYDDAGFTSAVGIQQGDGFITFSCTRKVDAAATYLQVYLYPAAETGTATYQVDRLTVSVGLVPIDAIVSPSTALRRLFLTGPQSNGLGVLHNTSSTTAGLRFIPSETADPSTAWTTDFRQDGFAVKQTGDAHARVDVRQDGVYFGPGSGSASMRIAYRLSDGVGLNANWYPNSNATYDLGAGGLAWRDLNITRAVRVGADQVVGARKTGWATATGSATRTTFDTTTVTLQQLAERVKALIDDLHGTAGHGLIGT